MGTAAATPTQHRWHAGELAVQARVGESDVASRIARSIHTHLPPVAATFLGEQPMLVIGAADDTGALWTSLLVGSPGFIRPSSDTTVEVGAHPAPGDPLAAVLSDGPRPIGSIAIEPASRRRMRLNGRSQPIDQGLRITLEEVFANCPKYISARTVLGPTDGPTAQSSRSTVLSDDDVALMRRADTFFISTGAPGGGVDTSHRGGRPGFVAIDGQMVTFGDYAGNSMYTTLGNLEVNPRAGLLFMDFATGDTLQITGAAAVDFDMADPVATGRPTNAGGALRMVRMSVDGVVRRQGGMGLVWGPAEASRFSPDPAAIGGKIGP